MGVNILNKLQGDARYVYALYAAIVVAVAFELWQLTQRRQLVERVQQK